ncbi:MAG TPA: glycoside hydrolase family 32 protein [Prolixibacteraceae bacterium]|nr:glycoside hydrolase family 32 protein [Prolixibacteraceae bacterium]
MNKPAFLLCALLFCLFFSCKKDQPNPDKPVTSLVSLSETDYRPTYHFTPPAHWMNDPNGLVFYNGEYHLFYQYNPNGNTWGPMNWGHTFSTDLFNWKDLPIALMPDQNGTIFSGSAVIDSANTSGLKVGSELPMVAIYTSAGAQQAQSIAYSNDKGRNWTKFDNNPVLPNPGINDFRDPKVSWFAPQNKWVMALATGNKISFYSSPDLKKWTFESEFGLNYGAHGGVWECPDLFQLPVEGTNLKKWVLLVSINPGGPNGGSATQYFIGNFDGNKFTADVNETAWIDWGTDNYAGVTYSNIPTIDGRRIMIGWMSNWNYADKVPTTTWRSTMTVPRAISMAKNGLNYILKFNPIDELKKYYSQKDTSIAQSKSSIELKNNEIIKSGSYDLSLVADFSQSDSLLLTIGSSVERLFIAFDKKNGNVSIDRSQSGLVGFNDTFKQKIVCPSFTPGADQKVDIRILVDKTSVELFWNKGEKAMTTLFFPKYQYNLLKVRGSGTSSLISGFSIHGLSTSLQR